MLLFSLLAITLFVRVKSQTGGTLANGDSYVCVPAGYCNNGGTPPPNPGIDPRIVTPGELCPSGLIPCYAQGPSSRCGERLVTPAPSSADGPAPAGSHPWVVFLTNSTHPNHAGSGVIIDNYHVLTAAHKVAGDVAAPGAVAVTAGVNIPSNSPTSQRRTAANIRVHPSYNPATLMNDIAIVRVSEPFSFSQNDVNSLCLPTAGAPSMFVGQSCIVAGWGETQFMLYDNPTNPMRQVNVNVIDTATCRAELATVLLTSVDIYLDQAGELCAGGVVDRDACTFDGGSPLTCPATGKGTMAGLVIWGKGCGQSNVPGVYVSTSYYRGWIDTTITALNNS